MKPFRFLSLDPVVVDTIVVTLAGMLASMAFVTAGYMVFRQIF